MSVCLPKGMPTALSVIGLLNPKKKTDLLVLERPVQVLRNLLGGNRVEAGPPQGVLFRLIGFSMRPSSASS
jgi:hypothetical protein